MQALSAASKYPCGLANRFDPPNSQGSSASIENRRDTRSPPILKPSTSARLRLWPCQTEVTRQCVVPFAACRLTPSIRANRSSTLMPLTLERGYRIPSTSCCAPYILVTLSRIAALFIAMDLHQVPNRLSCCPGSPDQGLVPPQRRAPLYAFHAATPGANSFLRRSVARKRFCFRHRSAW